MRFVFTQIVVIVLLLNAHIGVAQPIDEACQRALSDRARSCEGNIIELAQCREQLTNQTELKGRYKRCITESARNRQESQEQSTKYTECQRNYGLKIDELEQLNNGLTACLARVCTVESQSIRERIAINYTPDTKVTVRQWRVCVNAGVCPEFPIRGKNDDAPVTSVTWVDARIFAGWLSGQSGRLYRLPDASELKNLPPQPGQEWTATCKDTPSGDKNAAPYYTCEARVHNVRYQDGQTKTLLFHDFDLGFRLILVSSVGSNKR